MSRASLVLAIISIASAGCRQAMPSPDRFGTFDLRDARPELFLPDELSSRPDTMMLVLASATFDTDDESQPDTLPPLPFGMTLDEIRAGDALFHARGGCLNCHGSEAQGLGARGKTLTAGLSYVPKGDWRAIDSVISVGIPEAATRSPVAMPPRGQRSNLTSAEIRALSAYVWAISQVRGEPWPGGHARHMLIDWRGSARTDIP